MLYLSMIKNLEDCDNRPKVQIAIKNLILGNFQILKLE